MDLLDCAQRPFGGKRCCCVFSKQFDSRDQWYVVRSLPQRPRILIFYGLFVICLCSCRLAMHRHEVVVTLLMTLLAMKYRKYKVLPSAAASILMTPKCSRAWLGRQVRSCTSACEMGQATLSNSRPLASDLRPGPIPSVDGLTLHPRNFRDLPRFCYWSASVGGLEAKRCSAQAREEGPGLGTAKPAGQGKTALDLSFRSHAFEPIQNESVSIVGISEPLQHLHKV